MHHRAISGAHISKEILGRGDATEGALCLYAQREADSVTTIEGGRLPFQPYLPKRALHAEFTRLARD